MDSLQQHIIQQIITLAHDSEAKFVSFKFIDLIGRLCHIDMPVTAIGSKGPYIQVAEYRLFLHEEQYFYDPFRSHPTITCFASAYSFDAHLSEEDNLLRKNITDQFLGHQFPSIECKFSFFILDKDSILTDSQEKFYPLHAEPLDKLANLRTEIALILANLGIEVVAHYPGITENQAIISIIAKDPVRLADNIIISKYIFRNVAESYGKRVTFYNQQYPSTIQLRLTEVKEEYFRTLDRTLAAPKIFQYQYNYYKHILELKFNHFEFNPYILLTQLVTKIYNIDDSRSSLSHKFLENYVLQLAQLYKCTP